MTKLSVVINAKLKKKNNDDVRGLVKGTGVKNNLSFQESGLDKEVVRITNFKKNYSKPLKKITVDL